MYISLNYIFFILCIATYTKISNDVSDHETRQAAVNTIIVCLTSILICIGPCFVLTFISKWRQEQLKQKVIEDEKECDNGPPQLKLNNGGSKLNLFKLINGDSKLNLFGHRPSAESQTILLSLRNFKKSTSSSAGSIYSLNGDFCFKQEKIGM